VRARARSAIWDEARAARDERRRMWDERRLDAHAPIVGYHESRGLTDASSVRFAGRTNVALGYCEFRNALSNGEFSVALIDGTLLKLSRGYRESLDLLIGPRL
jgi:hypothetical protein